ncbi:heme exporter protein CcmB [Zymobacter palmae]|uniref:Heme exporter protein B n=1 Tax=Zymobacter palmae TaxID=33074 RepID=A0A348HFY1_9GAMM|nr:heme exporter protein CcmB [Zymobacter palmae]BBG30533.1 ABC-type transport system [Zymobacter palmae]
MSSPDAAQPLMSLWQSACYALQREWRLCCRQRSEWLQPLAFFIVVIALFPLGLSGDLAALRVFAPGIIWVAALLAVLLSLDRLFRDDYLDGVIEQWVLSPQPLVLSVTVKVMLHWCLNGCLLALISPLLGVMLGLSWQEVAVLACSLVPGSFVLAWIGAIGAALTVSLPRGGVLLSLLMLPLYVPVLIFGAGLVRMVALGLPWWPVMALLGGLMATALLMAPWVVAYALRLNISTQ